MPFGFKLREFEGFWIFRDRDCLKELTLRFTAEIIVAATAKRSLSIIVVGSTVEVESARDYFIVVRRYS